MSSDNRLIATRYAEALFDLAEKAKQHDQVKSDLQGLKTAIDGSGEFQKLLSNPVLSRENSEKAITAVMDAVRASDLTRKFFALLARNRRLDAASIAIEIYLAKLAASRGELNVEVTSAQALSAEDLKAITGSIEKSTGKKVTVKTQENPELLGGVQIRVGSQLLDNSVAGKLARLKQKLSSAA